MDARNTRLTVKEVTIWKLPFLFIKNWIKFRIYREILGTFVLYCCHYRRLVRVFDRASKCLKSSIQILSDTVVPQFLTLILSSSEMLRCVIDSINGTQEEKCQCRSAKMECRIEAPCKPRKSAR